MELCDILKLIEGEADSFSEDVVIQTNGFVFANSGVCLKIIQNLAGLSLDILIEVSLKGTCNEEFSLLTLLPERNFRTQLEAAKNLMDMIEGNDNLAYRLIIGYGPNKVNENLPTHLLVHPEHSYILQMRERWDPDFVGLYERYLSESPSGHLGFSMACLVTQRWGIRTLRNIESHGMLLRTNRLSSSERNKYENQWRSVHPYFTEMHPGRFYALEFP